MNVVNWLDRFHQSIVGHLVFGLIELALGYWAFLWAVDSGSLLAWILAIILLLGSLQNIIMLAWKATHRER